MNNKKGFTLVELLAVIVILGIILIIATMSVNKVIKSSRTKAFDETALVATKAAKKALLSEEGSFEAAFKEEMDYDSDEYDFTIENKTGGYKITLYAKSDGKFKNIDFNELTKKNSKFSYVNDYKIGIKEYKAISFCIDSNSGKLTTEGALGGVVSGDDDLGEDIGGGDPPDIGDEQPVIEEKDKFGKDYGECKAMEKKELYNVSDVVWLCNADGTKEEFYILSISGTGTMDLITKFGISAASRQAESNAAKANTIGAKQYDITNSAWTIAKNYSEYLKTLLADNVKDYRVVNYNDILSSGANCQETYNNNYMTYTNECSVSSNSWIYMGEYYYIDSARVINRNNYYGGFTELKKDDSGVKFTLKFERTGSGYGGNRAVRPVITISSDAIKK